MISKFTLDFDCRTFRWLAVALIAATVGLLRATPAAALIEVTGGIWGPGDFNADGTVDAADFSMLRRVVTVPAAYGPWRANYGLSGSSITTQPPADDPGWNNFVFGPGVRNFTYLGNGWALTAFHVAPLPTDPLSYRTLTFSTGTFHIIPEQIYQVHNPAGLGKTDLTDLTLVRLDGDPGLPTLTIATQPLTITNVNLNQPVATVTFIGQGPSRQPNVFYWDSSWNSTTAADPLVTYAGYTGVPNDSTKRWGMNRIVDESFLPGEGDTDVHGYIHMDDLGLDVMSMFTRFDESGIAYEAQAVAGDSGSAVFRKNGSQWELIGIVNSIFTYTDGPGGNPDQPPLTAVFRGPAGGDLTTVADLTYYYGCPTCVGGTFAGSIYDIMSTHASYSALGDVNLDGKVSGDGTGAASSDDVTAFIMGWHTSQAQGNVTSWKNGDMNLDGKVDLADYQIMQDALNGTSGAAALSTWYSGGSLAPTGVPEPSSLAACAAILSIANCLRWRRRSRVEPSM